MWNCSSCGWSHPRKRSYCANCGISYDQQLLDHTGHLLVDLNANRRQCLSCPQLPVLPITTPIAASAGSGSYVTLAAPGEILGIHPRGAS